MPETLESLQKYTLEPKSGLLVSFKCIFEQKLMPLASFLTCNILSVTSFFFLVEGELTRTSNLIIATTASAFQLCDNFAICCTVATMCILDGKVV